MLCRTAGHFQFRNITLAGAYLKDTVEELGPASFVTAID
jgi:hypothetical protein